MLTVLHDHNDEVELKALSAVFNSKLMAAFYKGYGVKGERKLCPKVVIRNLRELPYPKNPDRKALTTLAGLNDRVAAARQ